MMMSRKTDQSAATAADVDVDVAAAAAGSSSSSSRPPPLLERIRALDRSAELSHRYTALVLLLRHPARLSSSSESGGDSPSSPPSSSESSYVAVGHAERSFVDSTLLRCEAEDGGPIFVKDRMPNGLIGGRTTEVFRLRADVPTARGDYCADGSNDDGTIRDGDDDDDVRHVRSRLFRERTAAFERVTDHLLSVGVISRRHSDVYPVSPFGNSSATCINGGGDEAVAHVNRSAAPYLGIDSVGVHLHCYVCRRNENDEAGIGENSGGDTRRKPPIEGVWLAKRAPTKSHHPNFWDPTVAGGQPAGLSLVDNIVKEAHEEAGVPAEWIRNGRPSDESDTAFADHTHDPLSMTTAKPDGSCLERSLYYSCDLRVPRGWTPTPVDGEVSEFRLYSVEELEEELRFGDSVRPAMRAVLLDFMMRHDALSGGEDLNELRDAMRRERMILWQ